MSDELKFIGAIITGSLAVAGGICALSDCERQKEAKVPCSELGARRVAELPVRCYREFGIQTAQINPVEHVPVPVVIPVSR